MKPDLKQLATIKVANYYLKNQLPYNEAEQNKQITELVTLLKEEHVRQAAIELNLPFPDLTTISPIHVHYLKDWLSDARHHSDWNEKKAAEAITKKYREIKIPFNLGIELGLSTEDALNATEKDLWLILASKDEEHSDTSTEINDPEEELGQSVADIPPPPPSTQAPVTSIRKRPIEEEKSKQVMEKNSKVRV